MKQTGHRRLVIGIEIAAFCLIVFAGFSGRPPAHSQSPQESIAIEMMHDKDRLESLDKDVKGLQDSQIRVFARLNAEDTAINDLKVQQAGGSGSRTWIDGGFGTALLAILGLQVRSGVKSKGDDG